MLYANERVLRIDHARDSAALLFYKRDLPFPTEVLSLIPEESHLMQGKEIGWLGFPSVSSTDLCFFSGKISAYRKPYSQYLVDGVAINGVSGGPAFALLGQEISIVGSVTAYVPNVSTGDTLPGLMIVQDVSQFHEIAAEISSIEEARKVQTQPKFIMEGSHIDDAQNESRPLASLKEGDLCRIDIVVTDADGYVSLGLDLHFDDTSNQFSDNFVIDDFQLPEGLFHLGSQSTNISIGSLPPGFRIEGPTWLLGIILKAKTNVPSGSVIQLATDTNFALGIDAKNINQIQPDISTAIITLE